MIKKNLPLGLIMIALNTISAQKLTIDLEQNFRYISADQNIAVYLVESNYNQVVLSGANIDYVWTEVIDGVLMITVNPENKTDLSSIVVYYDEKYAKSNEMVYDCRPEGILSNTIREIPRIEKF